MKEFARSQKISWIVNETLLKLLLVWFQSGFNVVRCREFQDLERESQQFLDGGGDGGGRVQPGAGHPPGQGDHRSADEERGDHQGNGVEASGKEGAQVWVIRKLRAFIWIT